MTVLEADSGLVERVVPSPNHGDRRGGLRPDMILLHYTGMARSELAVELFASAQSQLSSHYVITEEGLIVQCVAEERRAWHAGVAIWAGETDINSCSIGIEIANPGHEFGYVDFPKRQIAAVTALCRSIVARYAVPPVRVLAHSDVAPGRKQDPGEKFPWHTLYDSGCTLVKNAFGTNGTVGSGSTASVINWSGSSANFVQGSITFTSGVNAGVTATVGSVGAGTSMTLRYPLESPPATGDGFTVYYGCDHTPGTCQSKFNNLANFRGFPYVPPPQIAY